MVDTPVTVLNMVGLRFLTTIYPQLCKKLATSITYVIFHTLCLIVLRVHTQPVCAHEDGNLF
jgi:uncharacterized membrane protein YgdD (TMEM256/DUF423 family)